MKIELDIKYFVLIGILNFQINVRKNLFSETTFIAVNGPNKSKECNKKESFHGMLLQNDTTAFSAKHGTDCTKFFVSLRSSYKPSPL